MVERISVRELAEPAHASQLHALRAGVTAMQKLSNAVPTDVIGYQGQIHVHCRNCGGGQPGAEDIHGTWSFLPWHRCFLHIHERILTKLAQETVRIPYWDWEDSQNWTIPSSYAAPGQALWHANRNPAGNLTAQDTNVNAILGLPSFPVFGGGPTSGSAAYSGPHARVHNWFRGIMTNPRMSPTDPVFYAHHANIDRLWSSWVRAGHSNSSSPAFLSKSIFFYDEERVWREVRFADLVDEKQLGYGYSSHMSRSGPGTLSGRSIPLPFAGAGAFEAPAAEMESLRASPQAPRLLVIEGMEPPAPDAGTFGVFLGAIGEQLRITDPGFLGYVSTLVDREHQGHGVGLLTASLELTGRLSSYLSSDKLKLSLKVASIDSDGVATRAKPLTAKNVQLVV